MKWAARNTKRWATVSALGMGCGGQIEIDDATAVDATMRRVDAKRFDAASIPDAESSAGSKRSKHA